MHQKNYRFKEAMLQQDRQKGFEVYGLLVCYAI